MNASKKFITIILTILMLTSVCPVSVFAIEDYGTVIASGTCGAEGDNIKWTRYDSGTLVFSGEGAMEDYSYQNDADKAYCEYSDGFLTDENGYEYIDENSICENETVKIVFEGDITRVGAYAFADFVLLESVEFNSGLEVIGEYSFIECPSLVEIKIPDGVTSIERCVFNSCENLENAFLPSTLKEIGDASFASCYSLKSIDLPEGLVSIGEMSFAGCSAITEIELPEELEAIGGQAFEYTSIESLHIPASVVSVGNTPVISVNMLGYTVDEKNEYYTVDESGVLYNKDMTKLISYPTALNAEAYTVSETVTEISHGAFLGNLYLKNLTASSVVIVGTEAFSGTSGLETVDFTDSLEVVGEASFYGAATVKTINLPDTLKVVNDYAFFDCYSLEEINIYSKDALFGECSVGYVTMKPAEGVTKEEFIEVQKEYYRLAISAPDYVANEYIKSKIHMFVPTDDETMTEDTGVIGCYMGSTVEAYAIENNVSYIHFEGHEHLYDVKYNGTCEEAGEAIYKCFCGDKYIKEDVFAPHTEVAYEEIEATCTKEGRTGGKYCDICGITTEEPSVVEVKPHTEVAYEEIKATCTEEGRTGGKYCDICGATTQATITVGAKGHSYGAWTNNYDEMKRSRICNVCGDTAIEALESTSSESGADIIGPTDDNADFEVEDVVKDSGKYTIIKESFSANHDGYWQIVKAFDINLKNKDGVHVQPDGTVKVKLPLDWEKDGIYKVYRVNDDGTLTDMNAYREGSHMVFETDHFSFYVIVDENEPEPDNTFLGRLTSLLTRLKNLIDTIINFFLSVGR